jgi:hypothetical protein
MNEDSNFIQLLVTELSELIKLAVEKLSDPGTKSGVFRYTTFTTNFLVKIYIRKK